MITTLDDLIGFIDESDTVPAAQKAHLRSALNRTRMLVCDGLDDIRADRRVVLRRLDLISPATVKMTPQSLANLKSRVRAAYRYATPDLAPARSHVRLKGEWQALEAPFCPYASSAPCRACCALPRPWAGHPKTSTTRAWTPTPTTSGMR
jgi:hypothetical protein